MILRNNARHPKNPKQLPTWRTELLENNATLERPLAESKTDRIYVDDMDYRCDPWDEPTIYDNKTLSLKVHVPNTHHKPHEIPKFPSPPSSILKNSTPTPTTAVTVTSTPINADDIICLEDKTLQANTSTDRTIDVFTPTSPQTAPATHIPENNEVTTACSPTYPKT